MKYAFYPGCVAKGACPELKIATENTAKALGIELVELTDAACTGAGVISEDNPELAHALNARTFAQAEKLGLPLLNICSTCQGNFSHSLAKLGSNPELLDQINAELANEGLKFSGNIEVKNFLWMLVEDFGLEKLKAMVKKPLTNLQAAPFYGCYILRPTWDLGYKEHPERDAYLEMVIETLSASPVDYEGKDKCCGFPIQSMNTKNSFTMTANHLTEAKGKGADYVVTPCPLCHLNLDANQADAQKYAVPKQDINLPILHLPQMVGLALGVDPSNLGLEKNIISTKQLVAAVG